MKEETIIALDNLCDQLRDLMSRLDLTENTRHRIVSSINEFQNQLPNERESGN